MAKHKSIRVSNGIGLPQQPVSPEPPGCGGLVPLGTPAEQPLPLNSVGSGTILGIDVSVRVPRTKKDTPNSNTDIMPSSHDSNLLSYGCQLSLRPDNIYGLMKKPLPLCSGQAKFYSNHKAQSAPLLENHTPYYDYHTDSIAI